MDTQCFEFLRQVIAEGKAKLEISLAKGKNLFDKRESIKQKDLKRDLDRLKSNNF